MDYNRDNNHKILWRKIYSIIFLFIFAYIIYATKQVWLPSKIVVEKWQKWNIVYNQDFQLSGTMRNANSLQINDHLTKINKNGDFKEQLLLQEGYNKISIAGTSRFGKKDSKDLLVYYKKN